MLAETRTVEALVDGLRRLAPHPISARELVEALYPAGGPTGELGDPRDGYPDIPLDGGGQGVQDPGLDELRTLLEAETRAVAGEVPDVRRVGKLFQHVQGRDVGGWAVRRYVGPDHVAAWCVAPAPDARQPEATGTRDLDALVLGLRALATKGPISARSLLQALYPNGHRPCGDAHEALRCAIEAATRTSSGTVPDARRLGKWLQSAQGRAVGGLAVRRYDGPERTALWGSEPVRRPARGTRRNVSPDEFDSEFMSLDG